MNLGNAKENRLFMIDNFKKYFLTVDDIDPNIKNNSLSYIIKNISEHSTILDVGCSYGYLGEWLNKNKKCRIYGIDIDKEVIKFVKNKGCYADVFCLDIDCPLKTEDELNRFLSLNKIFDFAVCADVLEHLKNPTGGLEFIVSKLKMGGQVIVSVPNIAHMDIILNLLKGKFNYSEFGILDSTHLRFFTKRSFVEWIKNSNELYKTKGFKLDVKHIGATTYVSEFMQEHEAKFSRIYVEILNGNEELEVLQHIFALTKIKSISDTYNMDKFLNDISRTDTLLISEPKLSVIMTNELNKLYRKIKELKHQTGMTTRITLKKLYHKILPIGSLRRTIFRFFVLFPRLTKEYGILSVVFYFKRYGFTGFLRRLKAKLGGGGLNNITKLYPSWIKKNEPNGRVLLEQKGVVFDYAPLISIIVPAYETPVIFLREMLDSVINQTYSNWELCLADGGSKVPHVKKILTEYSDSDKRIKIIFLDKNLGIALNSNEAVKLASGDYIAFLDHDDTLAPFALYEIVKSINKNPDADFIYTDEDKMDEGGVKRSDPNFKPDFSPDLLRSHNYITHFSVVKKELMKKAGCIRDGFEGSQDYDLILRVTEKAHKIIHIPKILYHWRMCPGSAAGNIDAKPYADDSAKKALTEHIERTGLKGKVENNSYLHNFRIKYEIGNEPLISIIIPNKDHAEVLNVCISSIISKSTYNNYEIIIAENHSSQQSTFELYHKLSFYKNIRIVKWRDEFNYSKINNFAANSSSGKLLLFLNNDIEVITPAWLDEMASYFSRKEVGVVGAKLYFGNNLIQHAGDIIGIHGAVAHSHSQFSRYALGYMSRLNVIQNLSAVTGACLMTSKNVFDEVGGFDEAYPLVFGDTDYCLKVRQKDYLVIFTPYAELYHYESTSRGHEDTKGKQKRFLKELNLFQEKWQDILQNGDPYYNPNLTLDRENFSLKL